MNTETFNTFLVNAHDEQQWDSDNAGATLWMRGPMDSRWHPTGRMGDPYDLLPLAVCMSPRWLETEVMLLMYGWASPVNDDSETEGERRRVRVMLHLNKGIEHVAIQFRGQTIEEFPDMGAGMFVEQVNELRRAQESLPVEKQTDAGALSESVVVSLLEQIFEDGGQS